MPEGRVRRPGGGRKALSTTDTSLVEDLRSLVEPDTRGDPQSALQWTSKSLRKLSQSLRDMGHQISANCCISSVTACKPTARRARERTIRIAMRNFATSTIV